MIANPHHYTETEKKAVADKYNATYAEVRGIESAETNFFAEGELNKDTVKGTNGIDKRDTIAFTDGNADNNDIYYDANKINEGDNFAQALGHESSRHDQAEKGNVNQTTDGVSTALDERAYAAGKHSVAALEREVGYKGIERDTDKTVSYVRTEKDQALIHKGTKKADGVKDVQPLMSPEAMARYVYSRGTGRNADEDWELIGDPARPIRQNHYNRNNNNDPDLATIQLPQDMNIFHTQGENAQGNIKFVSPDGHHEKIVDANGNLVTDPLNMGTYNFDSPDKWARHGLKDVAPYLIWGNSPDDSSTAVSYTHLRAHET